MPPETGNHWDTDFDPDHPDLQHEPPGECTDNPEDTEPGEGEADRGELPAEIPATDKEFTA